MEVLRWIIFIFLLAPDMVISQSRGKFPEDLMFGVASAAYQIEGAWNEDGKGENIWDRYIHDDPSRVTNRDNADTACDSYHKYKEDVALAAALGVQFYRFSISWTRILPTGHISNINPMGISYYQKLIEEILSYNMIPFATLYHWDLPQALQDEIGGFNSPLLVDFFVNYSRIAFQSFPKVGYWLTFNEPRAICTYGYGSGYLAPGIENSGRGDYMCAYVLLKAHAETYHMYKTEFPSYTAKLSMAMDGVWSEPKTNATEDLIAAERKLDFELGLYAHPLYIGNWPPTVIQRVAERSKFEKLVVSRLPPFTQEEVDRIKGTADFFGFNTYYTNYVTDAPENDFSEISFDNDIRVTISMDPQWSTGSNGSPVVAWGMRKLLKWIKRKYNDPEVIITENGVAEDGSSLLDGARITYYTKYLTALLDSIYVDEVRIVGFTAWSLMDNFEWIFGYSQRFGLHYIDFTDPNRTRIPKQSAIFYKELIEKRHLPFVRLTSNTSSKKTALIRLPLLFLVILLQFFT